MKILALLLLLSTPCFADEWLSYDKGLHAAVGYIGCQMPLVCIKANRPLETSDYVGVGLFCEGVFVMKELVDANKPNDHFSFKDLAADNVGMGLGMLVIRF